MAGHGPARGSAPHRPLRQHQGLGTWPQRRRPQRRHRHAMTDASLPTRRAEPDQRRRDWLPWAVGSMTVVVLFAFLIYPIFNTVLGAFVRQGNELSLANWTLYN